MKITRSNAITDRSGRLIQGRWILDNKHTIRYKAKDRKETLNLEAEIIEIKPASVVILASRAQRDQKKHSKIYRLTGQWRFDHNNRIRFEVRRNKGTTDKLTFKGLWKINKNHQITYSYVDQQLKTKKKISKTLTFQGFWDIADDKKLTYYFSKDSNSFFRVRGAFQTRSLIAKKGEIRYQAGIEIERRIHIKTIVLFGKWKYSDKLGLLFEIRYKNSERHSIRFGGKYSIDKNRTIRVDLTKCRNKPIGLELVLTKDLSSKTGSVYLKLIKSLKESRIEGGVKRIW